MDFSTGNQAFLKEADSFGYNYCIKKNK